MSIDKEQEINETKGNPYCPKWKHLRTTALIGQRQENTISNQILSMGVELVCSVFSDFRFMKLRY